MLEVNANHPKVARASPESRYRGGMPDAPRGAVRHEADLVREGNARFVLPRGPVDPHDARIMSPLVQAREPVRSLSLADVTLAPNVPDFVGEAEARALQAKLVEVRELNERYAGEAQIESFVRINGTPEQRDLINRSAEWGRRYAARRLARPSTRDGGCPFRRFVRLFNELLPFVDCMGVVEVDGEPRSASALGQYLGPMLDLVAWSLFQGTWAQNVVWSEDKVRGIRGLSDLDEGLAEACVQTFGVYRWKASRQFDVVARAMADALAKEGAPHASDDEERAQIALLAEDIAEMRPFLVRNFPEAKALVTLPGGLVAGFCWDTLDRIGLLRCAATEREILEQRERGLAELLLVLGHDGLLRCSVNWFRDVSTIREPLAFPPLAVGRVVLERVHARLFGFFDKIDLEAVCAGFRQASPEVAEEPDEEAAVIAASIATRERGLGPDGRRGGRVSSSLRLSELSSLLERHFGCTSRSSKGSELVFYREGERHAFVARHTSNPAVPAIAIQRMLRKLGIPVHDWLAATGA